MPSRSRYTLLIPTYNRPDHLRRLLGYLAARRFEFPIRVLDSSSGDALSENRQTVGERGLDIAHEVYDPAIPIHKKVELGVASVELTYCSLCADDDVLFTDELNGLLGYPGREPRLGGGPWVLRQLQAGRKFRYLVHGLLGALDRGRRRAHTARRADERLPGDLLRGPSYQHHEIHPGASRPRQIALGQGAVDVHAGVDRRGDVPCAAILYGAQQQSLDRNQGVASAPVFCHRTGRAFSRIRGLSRGRSRASGGRPSMSSELSPGTDSNASSISST